MSDLFQTLRGRVYQYLLLILGNPAEAEELTQECFLRLYQQLHKRKSIDNARVWLFHVARNLALDKKRTGRFIAAIDPPTWDKVLEFRRDPSPTPEQNLLQKERYELVCSVLKRLSDQEQQVLYLRAKGLSYRQVGEVMALSIEAVAAHVHRGLGKVKAKLNV
ncbi:MAG TPA: RNA polymerase sigma factor [Clostridia bacterium]|nr:RNA polymerase sigma factor [Clostridia bacterium]